MHSGVVLGLCAPHPFTRGEAPPEGLSLGPAQVRRKYENVTIFFIERESKMIICKDFDKNKTIKSIDEWKNICPSAGGEKQWQDGRSAKELAKEWIKNMGKYLETLLGSYEDLKELIS